MSRRSNVMVVVIVAVVVMAVFQNLYKYMLVYVSVCYYLSGKLKWILSVS